MKNDYILGIDQSTSGTKVLVVNSGGHIIYKNSLQHKQYYPQDGWVEHNPEEIYNNVIKLIHETIEKTPINDEAKALSITNQRETIVVWDKDTGRPIYNAVVWQCGRTTEICRKLIDDGHEETVKSKTGLTIDPYFSASKIKWILENVESAREKAEKGQLLLGTMDSWLIWKLTEGNVHATDVTNASRTLLYNIHTLQWDEELLKIFDIPFSMLPVVKSCDDFYGVISDSSLSQLRIQISGVIGDSQGALFGQRCFEKGMAKATFGTGTSLLVHTDELVESGNGLVTSVAWGFKGKVNYALEGIIRATGDVINWMHKDLELFNNFDEVEELVAALSDNNGVYLVPAFVGLGAPYWSPDTRAAITGMSRSTNKAHIVRAGLESIAYQVKDIIQLIEKEAGMKINSLKVDGGATNNQFLVQFIADMLSVEVIASNIAELSSMGSVYLGGLGVGIWNSIEDIANLDQNSIVYFAEMPDELRHKYYNEWKVAVMNVLKDETTTTINN